MTLTDLNKGSTLDKVKNSKTFAEVARVYKCAGVYNISALVKGKTTLKNGVEKMYDKMCDSLSVAGYSVYMTCIFMHNIIYQRSNLHFFCPQQLTLPASKRKSF